MAISLNSMDRLSGAVGSNIAPSKNAAYWMEKAATAKSDYAQANGMALFGQNIMRKAGINTPEAQVAQNGLNAAGTILSAAGRMQSGDLSTQLLGVAGLLGLSKAGASFLSSSAGGAALGAIATFSLSKSVGNLVGNPIMGAGFGGAIGYGVSSLMGASFAGGILGAGAGIVGGLLGGFEARRAKKERAALLRAARREATIEAEYGMKKLNIASEELKNQAEHVASQFALVRETYANSKAELEYNRERLETRFALANKDEAERFREVLGIQRMALGASGTNPNDDIYSQMSIEKDYMRKLRDLGLAYEDAQKRLESKENEFESWFKGQSEEAQHMAKGLVRQEETLNLERQRVAAKYANTIASLGGKYSRAIKGLDTQRYRGMITVGTNLQTNASAALAGLTAGAFQLKGR